MSEYKKFKEECKNEISNQGEDSKLKSSTQEWFNLANENKYSYHF